MKLFKRLKYCALAALVVGFTGMASADELLPYVPTAEQLAGDAADEQLASDLAALNADRYGALEGIKAIWGDNEDFADALDRAADKQLIDIQSAGSFDEVRAILQGRETALDLEGVIATEQVGERTRDLVFTPVVPCRIVDTRFDIFAGPGHLTGAGGSNGTTRSYLVWGSAGQLAHQGHNQGVAFGAGCPAPFGEPSGVHANFTAVPFSSPSSGKGNIRAWPVGGVIPLVSLVNYEAGTNIANTASVATRFLSSLADDLNVTATFLGSDQVVDVMGYYYPVREEPAVHSVSAGAVFPANGACITLDSITVSLPTGLRGSVALTGTAIGFITTGTGSGEQIGLWLSQTPASCVGQPFGEMWGLDANNRDITTITVTDTFTIIGSDTFYLNGRSTADTGSESMQSRGETMMATFYATP
jgi:hypothetical protein